MLHTHGSGVNLVVSSHRTVLTISFCVSFCSRQKRTPGLHLVCRIASQSLIYTWALMSLKKKCFLPRARNTVHLLLYLFWIQVSVLLKRSATVKHSPQHHYTCSLYKPLWDTAEVDWSQQKDGHWLPESLGCDVWAVWGLCKPDTRALIKKGEKNKGWKWKIHINIRVSLPEASQDYLKGVLFVCLFLVFAIKASVNREHFCISDS